MGVDEWRPHQDFSRFLIPGSPGLTQLEYEMFRAPSKSDSKKPKPIPVPPAPPTLGFEKIRHKEVSSWDVHIVYNNEHLYGGQGIGSLNARVRTTAETEPRGRNFEQMCSKAAVDLRLVTASGTNKYQDFMRFAAVFASRNPGLWDSFRDVDMGPGEIALAKGMMVKLWAEVHRDLTVLSKCYYTRRSTIIRASAVWLFTRLDRLIAVKRPIDANAKAFFTRFISGKNIAEAKALPDWDEFVRDFDLRHSDTDWASDAERDSELENAWETGVMASWQAKRMEILKWPKGKPSRK